MKIPGNKRTILSLFYFILFFGPLVSFAGNLEPSDPPAPTMKTLDEINPLWDRIIPSDERFLPALDGSAVMDRETGLVWSRSLPRFSGNILQVNNNSDAEIACSRIRNGQRFGWRVPTIAELLSLADNSLRLPTNIFDITDLNQGSIFIPLLSADGNARLTFIVDIGGYIEIRGKSITTLLNVWCVRGGGY